MIPGIIVTKKLHVMDFEINKALSMDLENLRVEQYKTYSSLLQSLLLMRMVYEDKNPVPLLAQLNDSSKAWAIFSLAVGFLQDSISHDADDVFQKFKALSPAEMSKLDALPEAEKENYFKAHDIRMPLDIGKFYTLLTTMPEKIPTNASVTEYLSSRLLIFAKSRLSGAPSSEHIQRFYESLKERVQEKNMGASRV